MQITCTEEKRSDPLSQPQLENSVTNPSYEGICRKGKQCDLGPAWRGEVPILPGGACDQEVGQPSPREPGTV